MRKAFLDCDRDRSGFADAGELHAMLTRRNREVAPEAIDALLGRCDVNGDGKVSFEEFSRVMQQASRCQPVL